MSSKIDRAKSVFGNPQSATTYRKAVKSKEKFIRKFGDDSHASYHLMAQDAPVIGSALGVRQLLLSERSTAFDIHMDASCAPVPPTTTRSLAVVTGRPILIGNIRMGFGHYRIAMAMASAAHAMGYIPYWFDLASFSQATGSKVIAHQNHLYSLGSRISQRSSLFNRLVWEPLNSEGFRKLSYNAGDQKNMELCVPLFQDLPKDIPFVGTHAWPSMAALHAGMTHVVNAIPDNWPMALHLTEGAIHTVQTPSSYFGYHQLRGMDPTHQLAPMPAGSLAYTGHYIDHELVENIPFDCNARRERVLGGGPVRYLLSVGGAGAQQDLFAAITEKLLPYVKRNEASLLINVGDHKNVWEKLVDSVAGLKELACCHFNNFDEICRLVSEENSVHDALQGVHAFCNNDIFAAVYSSNILMRYSDLLVTKPSEFSFYPVPKLMIHRVGGHEAWGAIRAAELGDGSYEMDDTDEVLSMIDAIQKERSLISFMCDRIEDANKLGIYDGAYKVIELAAKKAIES